MSGKNLTLEQVAARAHRHYPPVVYTGDGAKVEFNLPRSILRLGDERVIVGGLEMRPTDASGTYDYSVRGLTSGYPGDSNRIKLNVAPLAGIEITIYAVGG